jgi:hypothetical protein
MSGTTGLPRCLRVPRSPTTRSAARTLVRAFHLRPLLSPRAGGESTDVSQARAT